MFKSHKIAYPCPKYPPFSLLFYFMFLSYFHSLSCLSLYTFSPLSPLLLPHACLCTLFYFSQKLKPFLYCNRFFTPPCPQINVEVYINLSSIENSFFLCSLSLISQHFEESDRGLFSYERMLLQVRSLVLG